MLVNFGFVIDNELAGLGHPDSFGDVGMALEQLRDVGVTSLVSLDESGIPPVLAEEYQLSYLHVPIADYHPPTVEQALNVIEFVNEQRAQNRAVGMHCRAGYGRTGTMLACCLIHSGMSAEEAIDLVRRKRPGSIETAGQEQFLREFEKGVRL